VFYAIHIKSLALCITGAGYCGRALSYEGEAQREKGTTGSHSSIAEKQ
jgi:hypothetical protein